MSEPGERDPGAEQQDELSGFVGHLIVPPQYSKRLDSLETQRHLKQAQLELLYLTICFTESGQYQATLGEVSKLYKAYIVGSSKSEFERKQWRKLPLGTRPANRKQANNAPTLRKELRALYDQAQGLLEVLKAEGFNALEWGKAHSVQKGFRFELGGPDGVTYTKTALAELSTDRPD